MNNPRLTSLPLPKRAHAPATRFGSAGPLAALSLAVLAACSTTPPANDQVSRARSGLELARSDPQTRDLPGAEMRQATEALAAAEAALAAREDMATVDHLGYLAQQRVGLLVEAGNRRAAETAVAQANTEREQMRLRARTLEADAAQRSAAASQQQAQASQQQAQASQRDAQAAQSSAAAAQRDAVSSQRDAQTAQQLAGESERRARALEQQLRELNAKKTDRGMVVTIGDVLFDTGRAELKGGSLRSMDKLVTFLKTYPQRKAVIEGFTDSVGSDELNQALSMRRAEAVRNALVGMGVGSDRLSAAGLGEAFPVAGNEQAAGRQLNRRVEIVLSDDNGQVAPR
jgi:outer membrane protein OmpA-like peptidoglycan-associated protein